MQHTSDANVVGSYGEGCPTFGGAYFDGDELEVLVVLFTCDLEFHAQRLAPLLTAPHQFRVALAERTWRDVKAANRRVQTTLLHPNLYPGVSSAGIGMADGQFVITVGVDVYSDKLAEEIRELVAPDVVRIEQRGRATLA